MFNTLGNLRNTLLILLDPFVVDGLPGQLLSENNKSQNLWRLSEEPDGQEGVDLVEGNSEHEDMAIPPALDTCKCWKVEND